MHQATAWWLPPGMLNQAGSACTDSVSCAAVELLLLPHICIMQGILSLPFGGGRAWHAVVCWMHVLPGACSGHAATGPQAAPTLHNPWVRCWPLWQWVRWTPVRERGYMMDTGDTGNNVRPVSRDGWRVAARASQCAWGRSYAGCTPVSSMEACVVPAAGVAVGTVGCAQAAWLV